MATHFTLELDTTAPQMTWGDVPGAVNAGGSIQVPYETNEPGAIEAYLVLSDTESPLVVDPEYIGGPVPVLGQGVAQIRVLMRDDVGNEGTSLSPVFLIRAATGRFRTGAGVRVDDNMTSVRADIERSLYVTSPARRVMT